MNAATYEMRHPALQVCVNEMEIGCCEENERDLWDSYLENNPSATISHLYGWRRIISGAYGHATYYLAARQDNNIFGILPLVLVRSRLFGSSLASMPFQDYGGIVADDPVVTRNLLEQALKLRNETGVDCAELRHRDAIPEGGGLLRQDKVTLLLDLSPGTENLWKKFSGKVRNQVRKAEKSGLTIGTGGAELLEDFYRVFAVNMRDLGSPVHHPRFFSHIFSEFGNRARLLVVRDGSRTIGGLIALFFKDAMVVPWASSLREYFSKCPNNLLYWHAFQLGCDRGCKVFDFGRSSIGSGTYNFKVQWGAEPIQLNWQLFFKRSQAKLNTSEDWKLQAAARVWSRLPVNFTRRLGPAIRKYLVN
jgi:FemAB-related protein (PEP-CTERM system-associated)